VIRYLGVAAGFLSAFLLSTSCRAQTRSEDQSQVSLEVTRDSLRGAVMWVFREHPPEIEWSDASLAEEPVSGTFRGTRDAVLCELLATYTDFIISFEAGRVSRIVVFRKAASASKRETPRNPVLSKSRVGESALLLERKRATARANSVRKIQHLSDAVRKRTDSLPESKRATRSRGLI
jgi:hypothetical protein